MQITEKVTLSSTFLVRWLSVRMLPPGFKGVLLVKIGSCLSENAATYFQRYSMQLKSFSFCMKVDFESGWSPPKIVRDLCCG